MARCSDTPEFHGQYRCGSCHEMKDAAEFCVVARTGRFILQSYCRPCQSAYHATWRAKNLDHKRQHDAEYYRRTYEQQKPKRAAYAKQNRARLTAREAAWRKAHPERNFAYQRKYLTASRDRVMASGARWERDNSDKRAIYRQRRLDRIAAGDVPREEWLRRVAEFDSTCAYCFAPIASHLFRKLNHMEHIQPLGHSTHQGHHHISNVVPACTLCNKRKGSKSLREFAEWCQRVNEIGYDTVPAPAIVVPDDYVGSDLAFLLGRFRRRFDSTPTTCVDLSHESQAQP